MRVQLITKGKNYSLNLTQNDPVPRKGEVVEINGKLLNVTHVIHIYGVDPIWKEKHGIDWHYLSEIKISTL